MGSRAFRVPAFYALLFILVVELLAHRQIRRLSPNGLHFRNPSFRRGWPEYVSATRPRATNELIVLIISNSQGYGREVKETAVYAAALQSELEPLFPDKQVRVVNWSVPPCRGPEPVILIAEAQRLKPDLTFCILGPGAFAERYYHLPPENRQFRRWLSKTEIGRAMRKGPFWREVIQGKHRPTPLSMFLSDVPEAAWPSRARLPDSFAPYFTPSAVLRNYLYRFWPAFHIREWPKAWALRHSRPSARFLHEREYQTWFAPGFKESDLMAAAEGAEWLERDVYFPLLQIFTDAARDLPGKKIFINQPLQTPGTKPAPPDFARALEKEGWHFEDWRTGVASEYFLPRGTHFTEEGHRRFGVLLARLASDDLYRP